MTNRTVNGADLQYLIEKIIRSRINDSKHWKEKCFEDLDEDSSESGEQCERFSGSVSPPTPTGISCSRDKSKDIEKRDRGRDCSRNRDSERLRKRSRGRSRIRQRERDLRRLRDRRRDGVKDRRDRRERSTEKDLKDRDAECGLRDR